MPTIKHNPDMNMALPMAISLLLRKSKIPRLVKAMPPTTSPIPTFFVSSNIAMSV